MATDTPAKPAAESGPKAPAPAPKRPPHTEGNALNVFSHGLLWVWGLMVIIPVAWIVLTSFKTTREIATDPLGLPESFQWENYANAWTTGNIGGYFINTIQVMAFSVTGTMLLGAMAAYVLARYEFFGNRIVYFGFAAGMMFPVFLALFPLFKTLQNVALLNTYPGLVLVYIAYSLPFTVFFLTAFFRTLPSGVAEAAVVDGAGHYRLFFQVMLPMAKPGLIAITIFNIIGQWNQFLLPLVLLSRNPEDAMISQGLANLALRQGYEGDPGALFAGTVMAMLPIFVAYVVFQRHIQAGLTAGAIK
ncbi:carbohydrate ABC transporter permease [Glycomyces sp. TRM65418]|uniref:carbohydrate ABC transporter permease n=1 Tax=Glycomyces sp. TRM65418 TaxID=2867006 RepID=UPI001CE5492F|nr:carbohydrate ABC transporter permease [Glycomyces sp. TRM65418]MCC3765655.1 carbohydrate ABC transporter permease [Glycomyces sp. TRM65418]QZD55252.1 carbohydrate ABC transporter permease [Glycomyces sp. TRM65418]